MNTLRSMSIKKYGLFECFIFLSRNLHQTLIPVQENQCLFLAFQIYCFIVSGIKGSEKTKFPSIRYGFIIHISHSKTEKLSLRLVAQYITLERSSYFLVKYKITFNFFANLNTLFLTTE